MQIKIEAKYGIELFDGNIHQIKVNAMEPKTFIVH